MDDYRFGVDAIVADRIAYIAEELRKDAVV